MGSIPNNVYTNLTQVTVDKMDELRELVFGTSDMVKLGTDWEIIKPLKEQLNYHPKKKKKKRKKKI
ncbi:hypothetical protein LCGC14_1006980 [marine sediment metagenome]|uniref:Uncharacterized protein n=1 Tax=marine sediment metagenome TaxID=412755 RepID=A0A0F9N618_9ZZZZ